MINSSFFRPYYTLLLLFSLTISKTFSQKHNNKLPYSSAEKIYLQLDSKIYTLENNIWFKAIVTNSKNHKRSKLSEILYIELINKNKEVLDQKRVKLINGIGENSFSLSKKYNPGQYLIRAYTNWNRNFGENFFFKTYINVFKNTPKINTIEKTIITHLQNNTKRIQGEISLPLTSKKSKLFFTVNNQKQKFKQEKHKILFDFETNDTLNILDIQLTNQKKIIASQKLLLNNNITDLVFFPESGKMVHGLKNRIGFKAVDALGKGKKISGRILDKDNTYVTSFISNHLGMGSFILEDISITNQYYAEIEKEDGNKITYPLPKTTKKGDVLTVKKKRDKIYLTATSNYLKNDSIYISISCRGNKIDTISLELKKGKIQALLSRKHLPEGIIQFTLLNKHKLPLAERIYFNEKLNSRLNIEILTDKENYTQRDKTNLKIKIKGNNKSNLSVLVIDEKTTGTLQNTRQNILSYLLLSSDIKGPIEEPGFYFKGTKTKHNHLDALMLTQGWRNYKYNDTLTEVKKTFNIEKKITISGVVKNPLFNTSKKNIDLTIMSYMNKQTRVINTKTDNSGNFLFTFDDLYKNNAKVLFQSKYKNNKKNYNVKLNANQPMVSNLKKETEFISSDITYSNYIQKNIQDFKKIKAFSGNGIELLNEVVLTGYKMTPKRKEVTDKYGKPDLVINQKKIQQLGEKYKKWAFGLYSVLRNDFPELNITTAPGGFLIADVPSSDITYVVIDGITVADQNYDSVASLPVSEIKSVEFINQSQEYYDLFFDTFPDASPLAVPPVWVSVIAIYTHAGNGLFSAYAPKGLSNHIIPILSSKKEFYTPKHNNLKPEDWLNPDLRNTVFWKPNIKTDNKNEAKVSFYNSDDLGKKRIIVESISEDGQKGYQELIYDIQKKTFAN